MNSPGTPCHPAPFSIQEFNELVSSALDIDCVPLPLLNFVPPKSDPSSLEWTAELESYVDNDHDLLALDHPLLNLGDMSVPAIPPSPSFFDKVKSRANAFVRRGKHEPPSPTFSNFFLPSEFSYSQKPRSLSLPHPHSSLTAHPTPSISAPVNIERPSCHPSSRSFVEPRVTHYPFSQPCMAPPPAIRPLAIRLPIRKSKSEYSSLVDDHSFSDISASPSTGGLNVTQPTPRSPSPYTCPRTPPLPTPPSSSKSFQSSPTTYSSTRRGSSASASSAASSMLPSPSVESTNNTFTSRISTSFSFSKLGAIPFSRSRSRLGLTLDTNVVQCDSTLSASTTCYSPLTPQTPSHFPRTTFAKKRKCTDFTSLVSCPGEIEEEPFAIGRVLTPDADPFARADVLLSHHSDSGCSDAISDTPTIRAPIPHAKYSFPPTPISPYLPPRDFSDQDDYTQASQSPSSPPPFPPPPYPPPRYPPPKKPLPAAPTHIETKVLSDWTLCLPSPTAPQTCDEKPHSIMKRNRSASSGPRVRFSPALVKPSSPFSLVGGLPGGTLKLRVAKSFPEACSQSESISVLSSPELQSDAEWPLPPRRTVVVADSNAKSERLATGDGTDERGRSLNPGWHDVEQSIEYFSPKMASPRLNRRHSIRFPKCSHIDDHGVQPLSPSALGDDTASSLKSSSTDGSFLPSPACQTLNEQQLKIIPETFGSRSSIKGDRITKDNNATRVLLQPRTSHESVRPLPVRPLPVNHTRNKTGDSNVSLSSSGMSYYTAKSRSSMESDGEGERDPEPSIPYCWKGVKVVSCRGHWEIWLLGYDGFLDGEEDSEVKVLARSWSELMEFCAAHQRVVIGRNVSKSFKDDPVVLRVFLLERPQEAGMEMTLALERASREPVKKAGASTLLAFQLPAPTTLGEVARFCKKGSVGQGV